MTASETAKELQKIIDDAPDNAVAIKMFDKAYRWHFNDNTYSKVFDDDSLSGDGFEDIHMERSLDDIREILELRKEVQALKEQGDE